MRGANRAVAFCARIYPIIVSENEGCDVSQPAQAVGRFKEARQDAAFGPEQASDLHRFSTIDSVRGS